MRAPDHLPIGLRLDQYTIESVLGSGGSGITYRAIDAGRRKFVALKEYFPKLWAMRDGRGNVCVVGPKHEANFRWGLDRFIAEAETLARFKHDCIVKVERVFGALGSAFIQLEYHSGPNLERWISDERRRPLQDELDGFAAGLLGALSTIHRSDILHCDISPRNILLSPRGLPVIIDFGSARQGVGGRTEAPSLFVTPHYAAQEQYVSSGAQQGAWTDIYSAAATLYRLVCGAPPPPAPARAISPAKVDLRRASDGSYRSDFLSAIEWGLEFLPQDRPRTVEAWRSRLLPPYEIPLNKGLRVPGGGV